MTINSPVAKVLLFLLAAIGLIAVIAIVGMFFMHTSMMSMMNGSPSEMAEACRGMMARFGA
jgi:uncharacterized protein YneF (UPF0154 family)